MKENYHIADLIAKKIKGVISPEEEQELDIWIKEDPENLLVYTRASDPKKQLDRLEIYGLFNKERAWAALEDKMSETKTIRFTPQKAFRYAAAIVLPLLIAGGFAYKYLNRSDPQTIAEIDNVFQPGSQKAAWHLDQSTSIKHSKPRIVLLKRTKSLCQGQEITRIGTGQAFHKFDRALVPEIIADGYRVNFFALGIGKNNILDQRSRR